jgi:hypothetical protein
VRLSTSLFFRAAAVVSLLYGLGHMSGIPWTPSTDAAPSAVVEQMRAVSFVAEGANRTYWDFYFGFGLIIGAFLVFQAVSLWFLAAVARRDARLTAPLAASFLVGSLVNAAFGIRYFFALPPIFAVVIAVLLGAGIWASRARTAQAAGVRDVLSVTAGIR